MHKILQPSEAVDLRVQTCIKTVMDTTDPEISFDTEGVCNYWHEFQDFAAELPIAAERSRQLETLLEQIKSSGQGKAYDCVIGLSGGVDSSYLVSRAKSWGLRPLTVHFDNGWNTELAVSNIEQLVSRLGLDLETFVMDWDEFRDVQRSYFKASVIDLEVPTDHMVMGALYRNAAQRGIRYILSGANYATEWLLPRSWYYSKQDLTNLLNIHRRFGERRLKRLPMLGFWQWLYYRNVRGIESVRLLDYVDYNKAEAKRHLMEDLGWRDYGGKHYESVFTRFYQGYVLPRKFGVDKRTAHLSTLILTGQMTRELALHELQQPTYDEVLQQQDKEYVAKKLGFSAQEFEAILSLPNKRHEDYGTDAAARARYLEFQRRLEPLKRILRGRI